MKKLVFAISLFIFFISCKSDDTPTEEVVTYPTPELLQNLSQLNLFKGDLKNLTPISVVEVYDLQTSLFTDYCHKKRFISIPEGQSMVYTDGGLPIFPDNTILAKTFYYNKNENDLTQGKIIIETRVLIKKAGIWEIGNYIWNEEQTDALRDEAGITKTINWIDISGNNKTVDYKVPDYATCVMCHNINGVRVPIGPKIRNLNKGNQLQYFMDNGLLTGVDDIDAVNKLPNWEDSNYAIDERARAYIDINCAHCHQPGGHYNLTFHNDSFEFRYETRFSDTHIFDKRDSMLTRIESNIEGYKMPFVGTSIKHAEGVSLLNDYLNSL